ncbi:hypothetical protein [Variovorax sp. PAMC 28711]|uniref:hypothetical protein n=1 Tax=Variovorax sp. PAMC 28711 TaxID=1795631 RepID=UPI00078D9F7D|nr:hypothetical protein [Variovorax sp. PAMC 28711]AMM23152.1 hypothetical protein AX767_01275 [Variovorax sp. PAMC 28711]
MDHLRRLTVFVDEPDPGVFHWVIIESKEDATVWEDVEASMGSFTSWADAWAAGVKALHGHVADPAVGPRAEGEDENADPVG